MFRIAKAQGCRFYLGSDAHHPDELLKARRIFERAIDLLDLRESDKFQFCSKNS
jgi:histidinol phosphatase-like PHP family hydrolase